MHTVKFSASAEIKCMDGLICTPKRQAISLKRLDFSDPCSLREGEIGGVDLPISCGKRQFTIPMGWTWVRGAARNYAHLAHALRDGTACLAGTHGCDEGVRMCCARRARRAGCAASSSGQGVCQNELSTSTESVLVPSRRPPARASRRSHLCVRRGAHRPRPCSLPSPAITGRGRSHCR